MTPDFWHALALGALQGATEFLPVSSSAHLIILPEILGWPAASLTFDVAVHWATALAVALFFRREWADLLRGAWRGARARPARLTPEGRLLVLLAIATVPAAVAGVLLADTLDTLLQTEPRAMARLAASMLLVTGCLLVASELVSRRRTVTTTDVDDIGSGTAGIVGVAQACAIVPGISRSGATIAGGLARGVRRDEAARFSFLLAAPIMLGAGAYQLSGFAMDSPPSNEVAAMAAGFVAAFVVGYLCIGALMRFVRRSPLYVFAAYTWVAGLASLWLLRGP
jgi:undecaprenyl-diphosphatase